MPAAESEPVTKRYIPGIRGIRAPHVVRISIVSAGGLKDRKVVYRLG